MIDTALIRSKVLEQAVTGELSIEFDSDMDSFIELRKVSNRNIVETKNEVPYELKEGWHWFALSELGSDDKHSFADGPFGSNLKKEHYTENAEVRIIQLSNVGELGWKNDNIKYTTFEHLVTIQRSEVVAGNIVIAKMMPAGRAIIVPDIEEKYVLSSDCVKFVPCEFLNTEFLCYAINSSMFRKQVLQDVHGIGRERTSLSKLKTYLLPIPCRAEQDYIVEKINKAYEQLASLDILQTQYSADLEILKSKIIDAGIQGKLTEQLPEDGTAEELLEQIREKKDQMIKEGLIPKESKSQIINDEDKAFDIPKNWACARVQDVATYITDYVANGSFATLKANTTTYKEPNYAVFVRTLDLGAEFKNDLSYIDEASYEFLKKSKLYGGELILPNIGASIGKAFIMPDLGIPMSLAPNSVMIKFENATMNKYFYYVFQSSYGKGILMNIQGGAATPKFSKTDLRKMVVMLPPLAEQERIVNKIEEIFELL